MSRVKTISLFALSTLFIFTGLMHFFIDDFLIQIIPPIIPFKKPIVYITGIAEITLAILVHFKQYRSTAAYALIFLLITVFQANIYMAINHQQFSFIPEICLYLRLPLQAILIYWVSSFCYHK